MSRNAVVIDEVTPSNQTVQVVDTNGGKFRVPYNTGSGSFLVPKSGEVWIIEQQGYQWQFVERYDNDDEGLSLDNLSPGDNRVLASEKVKISAKGVEINGVDFGVTTWDRFDIPKGGSWSVTLSNNPVSTKSVQVFNNGNIVDPSFLTVLGNFLNGQPRIKFSQGTLLVYYQFIP